MPRCYSASAKELTLAANLEIFSLYMTTNNAIAKLKRFVLSMTQTTLPTAQGVEIWIQRFYGATQNTSGALTTPSKEDPGDAASAATLYVGNTSLSTGTLEWNWLDGCYLYTGRDIIWTGEILVPKTRLLSVAVANAPAGSPVVNCVLEWEEAGV